jgi:hypothetical protein
LSFGAVPNGLVLHLDGIPHTTPFVKDSLDGFVYTLEARNQIMEGAGYQFVSWSDGGAQIHQYTTPATAQSIVANFQPGQVIVPGLVAAYAFDEGGGTAVADTSGNGHSGTLNGAAWSTQGKFGNALSFDGINDWVTINSTSMLDLTTGMTLEAWVFPTSTSGTRDILIKEGSNVDIYNLYARNWRGRPESNVFVNGRNRTAEGATLPANTWTHVAGAYDGSVLRLFINGVQAASTSISGSIASSTGPLRIGGNSIWNEFFLGRIDEIRIYNRALTQSEIQSDMNSPLAP